MKLSYTTPLAHPAPWVWAHFNETLFRHLMPRFPPARLERYDGGAPGSLVVVRLGVWPLRQRFASCIRERNDAEMWFVDEGTELPFFLRSWKHTHRVVATETGCQVIDEVQVRGAAWLPNALLRRLIDAQFGARKPLYSSYYNKLRQQHPIQVPDQKG